jgi:hypothetical protein
MRPCYPVTLMKFWGKLFSVGLTWLLGIKQRDG